VPSQLADANQQLHDLHNLSSQTAEWKTSKKYESKMWDCGIVLCNPKHGWNTVQPSFVLGQLGYKAEMHQNVSDFQPLSLSLSLSLSLATSLSVGLSDSLGSLLRLLLSSLLAAKVSACSSLFIEI
jgi:hypothetical protein